MNFIFFSVWDSETFILVKDKNLHENRTVFRKKALLDWDLQKEKFL